MPVFMASDIVKIRSENYFGKNRIRLLLLVLVLLVFSIYANALRAPFFFDDLLNITQNPAIRLTQLTPDNLIKAGFESHMPSRPVANISFGLNYYFGGYQVMGYHLVNIVIHIITGLLLYLLFKTTLMLTWGTDRAASMLKPLSADPGPITGWRSLDPSWLSFWAAALWLVHPIQTQSVTYIVQRMNSLAAMFCILSLLLYARARLSQKLQINNSRRPSIHPHVLFAGSLVSALLAFGSKETAATLPVLILLYELYFFQNLSWSWVTRNYFYVGIVLALFVFTAAVYLGDHPWDAILAGYAKRDFTPGQRVLTEFRVVIFYIGLLIWPHPSRLNLEHDFTLSYSLFDPVTTVVSLGLIIGLMALAIYLAPRQRFLSFCLLWFLGNLVIESSVVGLELVFEHRLYLPSMFLSLAAAMLFCRYVKFRWLQALLLGVVVMVFAFWTFERNTVWSDEVALYRDCVEKSPTKFRAHNNLGVALIRSGKPSQAIYHFQEALRLVPGYIDAQNNLNKLEANLRVDEEIAKTERILSHSPEDPAVHCALGNLYMQRDRLDEAETHFQKTLKLDPGDISALSHLAGIYALTAKYDKAISLYQELIIRQPENPDAFFYIACIYAEQNENSEAIAWLKKAAERGYRNPNIFKNGLDLNKVLRPLVAVEKTPGVRPGTEPQ
jgi:tetratricopeptide (TPR) repeat protein